jgi:hypothetical protein
VNAELALMIDNPEKTPRLLAALKAAAPFEVELPPSLIDHLQAENVVNADRMHRGRLGLVAEYQKHRVKKLKKQSQT